MSNIIKVVKSLEDYPETLPSRNGKKILDTYVNLKWLLEHFNAKIRFNLMTRKREISFSNFSIFPDDIDNSSLALIDYLATNNEMPTKKLDSHLDMIAFQDEYHPICECIKSKVWDCMPRLDRFVATIKSSNMALSHKIIKTWMMAAVAAAFSKNGFINQGVLVLQGNQNVGKTNWVKSLDPANCGAIKEGAILDPTNKDNVLMLAQHWIVELGELDATFKKADIARLKSFITMQADDIRFAYARKSTRLARRTVYAATVNEKNFLADETGNRRWWTISVESIDRDHGLDMQQVWAEAYVQWALGDISYLSKDIQFEVNANNEEHEKLDPLKEKILTWFDWSNPGRKWMTASDVLEEIGYPKPGRSDATRVANILIEINKKNGTRSNGVTKHEIPIFIRHRNS